MTDQVLLGQDKYNTIIYAEIKDGKIRGFNGYDYISPAMSYDENRYLSMCQWTHEVEINGVTYKSGFKLADNITPYFSDEDLEEIVLEEDFYFAEGSYCEDCGTFHDTDQYMEHSYVITEDCGFFCKDCVPSEELLVEVVAPQDLFSAKDMTGMSAPEGFEEVETLFCDSSGFGSSYERALTQEQATEKTRELMETHGELFAGITGIGQFQVYVTLYKRLDEAKAV